MDGILSVILSVQGGLLSPKLEDVSAISTLTRSDTVQLLRSDILGHGTFQIRINITHLQN